MKEDKRFDPEEILTRFDEFLHKRKVEFEAVVIGASALGVMGLVSRRTVDIDVLDPKIPQEVFDLAEEFRLEMKGEGVDLIGNWINNGPSSLLMNLPKDWFTRVQLFFEGKALTFYTLGRQELLGDKLWGFCDTREFDREAILNLKPTVEELERAADWVKEQEGNPSWPAWVDRRVDEILEGLKHEK